MQARHLPLRYHGPMHTDHQNPRGRAIRFVLGPDPWGGIRQPGLQRWALSRARRDVVVYLGPQVGVPEVGVGGAALDAATVAQLVQRWIQLAGHRVRGVYVIPRLDQVRLTTHPDRLEKVSGAVEHWLGAHATSPFQVVLGYPEARWLGAPPSGTWTWTPESDAETANAPVPAPWPSAPEHPLAVVVGARADHASWLHDLGRRAPAWRWLVTDAEPEAHWPTHTTVVRWPLWTDALAQVRAAACMLVAPGADPAAVEAWRQMPEARRLPWVGATAAFTGLPARDTRDYARALACVTWAEPPWLTAVRP
ncbi:MAG: hypothetical protein M0Z54_16160 [Thermaerobacter sp.]|nr:hypothetical protein [Thermaerobacter sp.]